MAKAAVKKPDAAKDKSATKGGKKKVDEAKGENKAFPGAAKPFKKKA
jgi:hypothetical protein